MAETLTLQIPDPIYQRLADTARATQRPLEEIVLRVLEIGSPPQWSDVPAEYQSDLAALDRMEDNALWEIVHRQVSAEVTQRFNEILESSAPLTADRNQELLALQAQCDRLMLCKAQAAAILRWRGHSIVLPPFS